MDQVEPVKGTTDLGNEPFNAWDAHPGAGCQFFCFQREPTAGPGATAPLPGPGFMMDGASTLGSLEIPAE